MLASVELNYAALPGLAALAVLVVVFRSISRRDENDQLSLWLVGWIFVLMHFVAEFLDVGEGLRDQILSAISLNTLELAGITFLASVTFDPGDRRQRAWLAVVFGIPVLLYTDAAIWNVASPVPYYGLIVIAWAGSAYLIWDYYRQISTFVAGLYVSTMMLAGVVAWAAGRGKPELGIEFVLSAIYLLAALFYWRNRHRPTMGVLTTTFGFVAWGLVFPAGVLLDTYAPSVHIESEVWNIPKYFVAVGMILTLLEDQVLKNEHLAYHDSLTGLPNRRLLVDRLEQSLAAAERTGSRVAVLVLDLDTFKQVNDTLGHHVGDVLLRQIVARLLSRVRAADTLARSGGDEFTLISDITDPKGAETLASALASVLEDPFEIEGNRIETSVSIGVAIFPDHATGPDDLRAAADIAMYEAKRAGRGRYAVSGLAHPHANRLLQIPHK
jgi:diguanylate cyclase (GGDEF)-like protein